MSRKDVTMKSSQKLSPLISLKGVIFNKKYRILNFEWKWKCSLCVCWIFWFFLKEHIIILKPYCVNMRRKQILNIFSCIYLFLLHRKSWKLIYSHKQCKQKMLDTRSLFRHYVIAVKFWLENIPVSSLVYTTAHGFLVHARGMPVLYRWQ